MKRLIKRGCILIIGPFNMKIQFGGKFYFLIIVLLSMVTSSCSISFEKRRYRPGYHVEVSKNYKRQSSPNDKVHINMVHNEPVLEVREQPKLLIKQVKEIHVSPQVISTHKDSAKSVPVKDHFKIRKKIVKKEDCDLLVMKDGVSLEVIVIEISETEIKYKKCNNPDGPTYIVPSSKVEVIHLKNGDYYRPNPDAVQAKSEGERDRMNEYLTATMVMAIINIASTLLGFIFVFVASFLVQYIGFIIACITLVESIIVFSLGFGGLKSKDLRATIAIIIGFIAFLLSILAIIIMFL